jgi:ketosteroid isomerase-like protein
LDRLEIEALEKARREAMIAGDLEAMDALFADDMSWVHGSSQVDDKTTFIEGFRSGWLQCFALDHVEPLIRIYGDVAMITGTVHMDLAVAGTRKTQSSVYTAIWVKDGDVARFVRWQAARKPAPAV